MNSNSLDSFSSKTSSVSGGVGKPKIAAVLPHMKRFGGVRRFVEVLNILQDRGYECAIVVEKRGEYDASFGCRVPVLGWQQPYLADFWILGDPPSAKYFGEVAAASVYLWVIAGGPYIAQYKQAVRDDLHRTRHVRLLLNNRSFQPDFPEARLVEGGINTKTFRPKKLRVGYHAGRGDSKGERQVINALGDIPHVVPVPFCGIGSDSKLVELMHTLDWFAVWEQRRGWSNMAAEALACGVPVVCNGVNVEPFADRCIITDDLRSFFATPMGKHSWHAVCDRLEEIFREDGWL